MTGSGTRSRPPLGAEAAGRSESLPAFNKALFLANGTRERRTGSRSVPQIWDPDPRLGPAPAIARIWKSLVATALEINPNVQTDAAPNRPT